MFVLRKRYKEIQDKLYISEIERKELAVLVQQIVGGLTKVLDENEKRKIGNTRALSEISIILEGCIQYIVRKAKGSRETE